MSGFEFTGFAGTPHVTTAPSVMLSGLQGTTAWCEVCNSKTEHNTAYHEQVINMPRKREGGYGTIELLIAAVVLIILIVILLRVVGA